MNEDQGCVCGWVMNVVCYMVIVDDSMFCCDGFKNV